MQSAKPKPDHPGLSEVLRACRGHLVLVGVFSAGINLLYFTPVLYMLQLFERVIPNRSYDTLIYLSLLALLALVVMGALEVARQRLLVRMAVRLERLLAPTVVEKELLARARGAAVPGARALDALKSMLSGPGVLALFDAPWIPLFLIAIFLLHPLLGVLVLAGSITLVLITLLAQRIMYRSQVTSDEAAGHASAALDASAAGAGVIRALGMDQGMAAKHAAERWATVAKAYETGLKGASLSSISKVFRIALQSAVLGLGAWLAIDQQINPGAVFAASILAARALQPVDQLIGTWKQLTQGAAAFERLRLLLRLDDPRHGAKTDREPQVAISARNVTCAPAPDAEPVVHDVSLEVGPGELVAIIGPSGAGKSTLAQALAGCLPLAAGKVLIGGAEIVEVDARAVGYMPQQTALFAGSVADNISRFDGWQTTEPAVVAERIIAAASLTGAHGLLENLPQGYQTEIGHGGRGLSGGQAQRVALARAFYGDPQIVILDEPNAHLDTEGEACLAKALLALRARGGCAVIVAQRTGILSICDRVVLMIKGRIVMDGPVERVLEMTGLRESAIEHARSLGVDPPGIAGDNTMTEEQVE